MATILVVEDEKLLGRSLAESLRDDGHRSHWTPTAEEALEWLTKNHADLALIDCRLPGMSGLELLDALSASCPDTAVIMMTAHADVPTAVKAMKAGALEFLIKPVDLDAVALVARKNLRQRRIAQQLRHEQKARSQQFGVHQIIGDCAGIEKAKSLVRRLSSLRVPEGERPPNVLIVGETGTGKDVFARAIHYEGLRRDGPFVHVNAAALPEKLVESELFGHVRGAFTGAGASKRGLFEVADGGTLFLDEVSALAMPLQAKVLTSIETGLIRPIGATDETPVDIHLVAAMNKNPVALVADGKFREDLYHRLRVVHFTLPPLRERGKDIDHLVRHFIKIYCGKFQMAEKKLSRGVREAIHRYDWPGNIRELSHCIESAVLLSGDVIELDHIPRRRSQSVQAEADASATSLSLDFDHGPIPLERVEREVIRLAMLNSKNNVSRAAELLDISRDALRYRLDKFKLNGEPKQDRRSGVTS